MPDLPTPVAPPRTAPISSALAHATPGVFLALIPYNIAIDALLPPRYTLAFAATFLSVVVLLALGIVNYRHAVARCARCERKTAQGLDVAITRAPVVFWSHRAPTLGYVAIALPCLATIATVVLAVVGSQQTFLYIQIALGLTSAILAFTAYTLLAHRAYRQACIQCTPPRRAE